MSLINAASDISLPLDKCFCRAASSKDTVKSGLCRSIWQLLALIMASHGMSDWVRIKFISSVITFDVFCQFVIVLKWSNHSCEMFQFVYSTLLLRVLKFLVLISSVLLSSLLHYITLSCLMIGLELSENKKMCSADPWKG